MKQNQFYVFVAIPKNCVLLCACVCNFALFIQVPDGGALNLVSKQSSFYNLSILPEKTDKSHKYETLNLSKFSSASPPLSRATSPLNHDHDGGLKVRIQYDLSSLHSRSLSHSRDYCIRSFVYCWKLWLNSYEDTNAIEVLSDPLSNDWDIIWPREKLLPL
jgi:hypothetical protein